jgi:small multidrug resistance family-3 protein
MKYLQNIHPVFFLLLATIFEVSGDAIIRMCVYNHTGMARIGFALIGTILLFGYGLFLNLAPVEFSQVVGLYIATLFIIWQIINYIAFKSVPTLPIILGGLLVVSGGLIITFWKPQ